MPFPFDAVRKLIAWRRGTEEVSLVDISAALHQLWGWVNYHLGANDGALFFAQPAYALGDEEFAGTLEALAARHEDDNAFGAGQFNLKALLATLLKLALEKFLAD